MLGLNYNQQGSAQIYFCQHPNYNKTYGYNKFGLFIFN